MALPTCYFLDADNADDTDLLSFYPYHPRYLFLKGILLKVLMRFPVLFLNFERHFLILSKFRNKTGRYINTLNRLAGQFTSDIPSFFLYIYLTIEVSGCRLPVTLFRNAFAEPKFRNKSRRTGRWFKSSVTKKVITSFSFPFLSYSTNEKIRQR